MEVKTFTRQTVNLNYVGICLFIYCRLPLLPFFSIRSLFAEVHDLIIEQENVISVVGVFKGRCHGALNPFKHCELYSMKNVADK